MDSVLDKNKELAKELACNDELQKIFTRIAVQLITADVLPVKNQKPLDELFKDAFEILKNLKISVIKSELKEAVATWAQRKIFWRMEKI
ncbi:MAG TPA: hypothetical protein PKH95_03775 [Candidatus Magasanikbacteria bacterium]|nr:hypothetical protein [Candidatus Magasanikbacteria bacterium]